MDFLTHIREALGNLISAKLRSFLAILGVLVGTASVVALISSSQLATANALAQFKALGTNLLAMTLEGQQDTKTAQQSQLTVADMPKLIKSSPQIVEAAPYINSYETFVFKGQEFNGQVIGATSLFADIAKIELSSGRFIYILDKHNFYAVIGATLANKIRKMGIEPLYKQILVGRSFFTIVGIAKPWQPNIFLFADINNGIIIPLSASYLVSANAQISNVLLRLVKNPNLNKVQNRLTAVINEILPDKKVSFRNPEQIIKIVAKQRTTFTWLLVAIGGISLLVGGIGVMNIMLVSVVERRREIGIRMAIGARPADILQMFLIESVILTVFGGIFGIIIGVGVSFILAFMTKWEFHLYLLPPILGFAVSVLVGIFSGFYPALRASMLDPIQTLTEE